MGRSFLLSKFLQEVAHVCSSQACSCKAACACVNIRGSCLRLSRFLGSACTRVSERERERSNKKRNKLSDCLTESTVSAVVREKRVCVRWYQRRLAQLVALCLCLLVVQVQKHSLNFRIQLALTSWMLSLLAPWVLQDHVWAPPLCLKAELERP